MPDLIDGMSTKLTWASLETVIISLAAAFLLGLLISFVYRLTNRGFSYESTFNLTLILVCIIVSAIMMTIGSNIALSLGLIGSLSIIRFRTVLKNTVDMGFLFWAIAEGLAIGAQNYGVAVGLALFLGVMIVVIDRVGFVLRANTDYIVVVNVDTGDTDEKTLLGEILDANGVAWTIRSSTLDNITKKKEVTLSLHSRKPYDVDALVEKLGTSSHVERVSLLSPETNLYV